MKSLLLFIAFFPAMVYSQDAAIPAPERDIKIGYLFSAEVSYRALHSMSGSQSPGSIIELRNKQERPGAGWRLGVNLQYPIGRNFIIESGPYGSFYSYVHKSKFAPGPDPSPVVLNIHSNFYNIGMPILIGQAPEKNKINFIWKAGMQIEYSIKAEEKFYYRFANGDTETRHFDFPYGTRKFNFFPTLSAGINYKLPSGRVIELSPSIQYGLVPLFDTPIRERIYSAGLRLSYFNL